MCLPRALHKHQYMVDGQGMFGERMNNVVVFMRQACFTPDKAEFHPSLSAGGFEDNAIVLSSLNLPTISSPRMKNLPTSTLQAPSLPGWRRYFLFHKLPSLPELQIIPCPDLAPDLRNHRYNCLLDTSSWMLRCMSSLI